MAIHDLFSKRQMRHRGESPDVYQYDILPVPFRIQVIHLLRKALGTEKDYDTPYNEVSGAYRYILEVLHNEYGVFVLPGSPRSAIERGHVLELFDFIMTEANVERVLDAVELSFRVIDSTTRKRSYLHRDYASSIADSAISDLNMRFKEHGIGYQYVNGDIIRIDSEYIHEKAVKPALALLRDPKFQGAEAEFLAAHEHYRHNRAKESLTDCLRACPKSRLFCVAWLGYRLTHGTETIPHGPDGPAMATLGAAGPETQTGRTTREVFASRDRQRPVLPDGQRLLLAEFAARSAAVPHGVSLLSPVAAGRHARPPARRVASRGASTGGSHAQAESGDPGQPDREDDRERRPQGVRRGKKNRRS
jgi:AbiJ N-terminal domain 4